MPTQIILLMIDTQRRDLLNCYAKTGLQTPAIRPPHRHRLRFDSAYTLNKRIP